MSCNENDIKKHVEEINFAKIASQHIWFEPMVRILGTSVSIGTMFYPIEVFLTRLQTGTKTSFNFNPLMYSHAYLRTAVNGYMATLQSSTTKNFFLSNKGEVYERSEGNVFLATAVIAFMDTLCTQYPSNIRVLNSLGSNHHLNMREKLLFAKEGMLIRGSKNFMTTLGCIATSTWVSDMINPIIPKYKNDYLHMAFTALISGCMVSPISNALDIIYKNKMKKFDPVTFTTPTYQEVIKELWASDGLKAFRRGALIISCSNTLAFALINGINECMNQLFLPSNTKSSGLQKVGFFAKTLEKPDGNEAVTGIKPDGP